MYFELRIDINQEVELVGMTSVEQDVVRFLSNLARIYLSRRSTPLTSTWRRYFGQKTTSYLHGVAIRSALRPGIRSNGP
jgi:hypothetical protein